MEKIAAALVVGLPHHSHIPVTIPQGGHCRILAGGGRAHDGVLVNLQHLLQDIGRGSRVAQTPARHGVGLGKAIDQHGPLLHLRQSCNGGMVSAVGELRINLIGDHKNVVLDDDFRNGLQILLGHDGSGGVVGEGKHQKLGPVRQLLQKLLRCQPELILLLQLDDHRHAIRQHRAGQVGHVAGLGNQHLIPRIEHSAHGNVNGLASAHRNHDLMIRVIVGPKAAVQIFGNFLL